MPGCMTWRWAQGQPAQAWASLAELTGLGALQGLRVWLSKELLVMAMNCFASTNN